MTLVCNQKNVEKVDLTSIDWLSFLKNLPSFPQESLPETTASTKHRTCPMCNKLKSFRFTDYRLTGDWICSGCGAGNGVTLIKLTLDISWKKAFDLLSGDKVVSIPPIKRLNINEIDCMSKEDSIKNTKKLKLIASQSTIMTSKDYAWKYLSKRVPYLSFDHIDQNHRFHHALDFYEEDENGNYVSRGNFPCLLVVVGNGHEYVTMHRHYLTIHGKKAPFDMPKQQMKGIRKLNGEYANLVTNKQSRVLAVGEGFETMAAVATAHLYLINVRSYLNEGNLKKAVISKVDFDKVIIYADHDRFNVSKGYKVGHKAAEILATRLRESGIEVEIRIPKKEETDWCDVWFNASLKITNLVTKLTTLMYQEESNDPFAIIEKMLDKYVK